VYKNGDVTFIAFISKLYGPIFFGNAADCRGTVFCKFGKDCCRNKVITCMFVDIGHRIDKRQTPDGHMNLCIILNGQ